jgi:hypothetical protein
VLRTCGHSFHAFSSTFGTKMWPGADFSYIFFREKSLSAENSAELVEKTIFQNFFRGKCTKNWPLEMELKCEVVTANLKSVKQSVSIFHRSCKRRQNAHLQVWNVCKKKLPNFCCRLIYNQLSFSSPWLNVHIIMWASNVCEDYTHTCQLSRWESREAELPAANKSIFIDSWARITSAW